MAVSSGPGPLRHLPASYDRGRFRKVSNGVDARQVYSVDSAEVEKIRVRVPKDCHRGVATTDLRCRLRSLVGHHPVLPRRRGRRRRLRSRPPSLDYS